MPSDSQASKRASNPVIAVNNLSKTYQRGNEQLTVLNNISLTIGRGEFVAIVGASGSGKTTLLNLIGLLDTFEAGNYEIAGESVRTMSETQLARLRSERVGYVFQSFHLLPRLSALKNVELAMIYRGISRSKRRAMAMECLSQVGLAERVEHLPTELSGGQQQRVAIARALANQPDLIIADEPTGSLDSTTGHEIMNMFCELNAAGKTIVMVTHEPDIAAYASRMITLRDGELVADSKHGEPA